MGFKIMYAKEDVSLKSRMEQAVDVSGAFDNCFFHNYALYLLSNNLPFPKDLFCFQSVLTHDSRAEKLHPFFPKSNTLNLFSSLAPNTDRGSSSTYIFEKTLILGVLLREWFATQLAANPEHKTEMLHGEHGVLTAFTTYKEYRAFMSKEALYSGEFGLLFESNASFLEYFFYRSENGDKSSPFEEYFSNSQSDEEAIRNYWKNEGYQLYCQYMAQPSVKLSYLEIIPMMKIINQSLEIYDKKDGSIVAQYKGTNEILPEFKIALHVQQGHYFLFKTEDTLDDLEEYERSYEQYKKDRDMILRASDSPVTCLFVRAICPKGHLDEEPFDVLLQLLAEHKPQSATQRVTPPSNYSFLMQAGAGAAMIGTTAAFATLLGIAIQTNQYDPGDSLMEETLVTASLSTLTCVGYGLYNFFQSKPTIKTQKESEMDLDSSDPSSSSKLKLS